MMGITILLIGALLVGVWCVRNLWVWFSDLSEGKATLGGSVPAAASLVVLVGVVLVIVRSVDALGEP